MNRVELKSIEPPPSVQDSMEKQMRAERDKRAAILAAEGAKRSAILNAEGFKESAILTAQGQAEAEVLKAEGEAVAIHRVFDAVNSSNANEQVLAYQYLQALPTLANGSANKVWFVPAELTKAMSALGAAFENSTGSGNNDGDGNA